MRGHGSSYAATAGLRPTPRFLDADDIRAALRDPQGYVDWVTDGMQSDALDEYGIPRRPALSNLIRDDSDAAIASAHFTHGYTMSEIACHLGKSISTISRGLAKMGSDPDVAPDA